VKSDENTPQVSRSRLGWMIVVRFALAIASIDLLLFGAAGRLDWPQGWWLTALFAATFIIGGPWVLRHDPDLLVERMNTSAPNVPRWDRIVLLFYRLLIVGLFVIAALDAARYRWSHVPLLLQTGGAVAIVAAVFGIGWCVSVNHFLASYARLQPDRGQSVVQDGPYRFVRHPMYTSAITMIFGVALLLGSWLALVPAALIGTLFVVRTRLEDAMLTDGLEGYRAYGRRVPNRIVPGVW
jgi:protein-S-isoprenylcysteine O-methyltransferase Ste14